MKTVLPALALALSTAAGTAAAAELRIEPAPAGLALSALAPAGSTWVLESSETLATWTPHYAFQSGAYARNPVTWPPEGGQRFFRLRETPAPDSAALIWVPPGRFLMGSPPQEMGRRPDEGPQRDVVLRHGFWAGRFEVTNLEFAERMGFVPSQTSADPAHPVENVSWDEAVEYCRRRTEHERQQGLLPAGAAYRLPSEAEWEYLCRAGTTTRFSYGDDTNNTQQVVYGWNGYNGQNRTHPVGEKLPNPWGFHDIHGNVFEWCLDDYGCYPGGMRETPQQNHVYRGGSWYCEPQYLRSASRHPGSQIRSPIIGFRVLLGAAPDTVLVAPEVSPPVAVLEWAGDGTRVTVRAVSATPDAWIRYSTNGTVPGTQHPAEPPTLTQAAVVKASAFLACSHRSPTLEVAVAQLPTPQLEVSDRQIVWEPSGSDTTLEFTLGPESWQPWNPALLLPEHGSLRARLRAPGKLTSPEVPVSW